MIKISWKKFLANTYLIFSNNNGKILVDITLLISKKKRSIIFSTKKSTKNEIKTFNRPVMYKSGSDIISVSVVVSRTLL